MNSIAELFSLGATIPFLVLSANVVRIFWRQAIFAIRKPTRDKVDLFIIGITIGFLGSFFDNLYWGFAWAAEYLDLSIRDWLFANGVWSNVPFRQLMGIVAAYLHCVTDAQPRTIFGKIKTDEHPLDNLNKMFWVSCVCGGLLVVVLWFIKHS